MICLVNIYIDDNIPGYMTGILRCSFVVSEDENGKEIHHESLIDNKEYHSKDKLIDDIAKKLNVDSSMVVISK